MKKILVIEDDIDICQLLKRFLSKKNFEVFNAYSGKKGIKLFDEENPHLVLCDFQLGDIDGSEVLAYIKEKNDAVPVIMMTAYSSVKTAVQVIKLGAYDYLSKPLLPDEVLLT